MKGFLALITAAVLSTAAFAQTGASVFDQFDADHDGNVTKAEAQANTTVAENFATADSNKDGNLNKSEFDAAFQPSQPSDQPPSQ